MNFLFFGFGMPGCGEWIVILFVALLIFGKRLPEVARSMGKSINEFKIGLNSVTDDIQDNLETTAKKDTEPKQKQTESVQKQNAESESVQKQ